MFLLTAALAALAAAGAVGPPEPPAAAPAAAAPRAKPTAGPKRPTKAPKRSAPVKPSRRPGAAAKPAAPAAAPAPPADPVAAARAARFAILRGLDGADLIVFEPRRTPGDARLALAAHVNTRADRLRGLLGDPATYQRAVPAFERAEPVGATAEGKLLAWELEVPLWNLAGKLLMRPLADGVRFDFIEGDLVPGTFELRAQPEGDSAVLTIEGSANLRDANFVTRRLAKRMPASEPAMAVTAAYVLLRGLVLEAERPGASPSPRRWPSAPMSAPAASSYDGARLGGLVATAGLDRESVVAAVQSRADGRLGHVEVAVAVAEAPAVVAGRIGEVARWRHLPGWGKVEEKQPGAAGGEARWEVDSSMPFVDFDSSWGVLRAPRFRATLREGDWQGATLGWDVVPDKTGAVAVFSLHPRLDTTGYMPRKLIAAEPLLEHGLAVGLGYVDAISLAPALR
jgi:hypothetical protein